MLKIAAKNKTHGIVIGIGERQDDTPVMRISAHDAARVHKELLERCPFKAENTALLINDQASHQRILDELESLIQKTNVDPAELVVIYFSGHGCVTAGQYYLIANDTRNADVTKNSIGGNVFIDKLKAVRTDKMLVLLDCCHAQGITHPGAAVPFNAEPLLQMANRVVISASHQAQLSYLSRPVSLFTYALVEGLAGAYFRGNDTDVSIFDLAMYIRERVVPLSRKRQHPQLHVLENAATTNFLLARYPNGELTPAFDEDIILLDESGKEIATGVAIEKDKDFRKEFMWMKYAVNGPNVEIRGDGNTVTINSGISPEQLMDVVAQIKNEFHHDIGDLADFLRQDRGTEFSHLADKIDIVETILLKRNSLLFIGRKNFKATFFDMLDRKINDVIIVKGKFPQTGLSYLMNFLSDIEDRFRLFEFVYINIKKISLDNEGQLVSAAHIAEAIAPRFGLTVNVAEFKLMTFLRRLQHALNQSKPEGRKYLFFIDQFDVGLATNVSQLMEGLASIVLLENANAYIIFSGLNDYDAWAGNIRDQITIVDIESYFDPELIDKFLEKVYATREDLFRATVSREAFITSAKKFLKGDFFEAGKPNIKLVGEALREWYRGVSKYVVT